MTDPSLLLPGLIFLPAALGFVGCVFPRSTFPFSVLALLGFAGFAFDMVGSDVVYAFTLVGVGGFNFRLMLIHSLLFLEAP